MQITDTRPAKVESPGQITAHAHTLYEIARELPDGALMVSLDDTGQDPRLEGPGRPLPFPVAGAAGRRLPGDVGGGLSEPIAIPTPPI